MVHDPVNDMPCREAIISWSAGDGKTIQPISTISVQHICQGTTAIRHSSWAGPTINTNFQSLQFLHCCGSAIIDAVRCPQCSMCKALLAHHSVNFPHTLENNAFARNSFSFWTPTQTILGTKQPCWSLVRFEFWQLLKKKVNWEKMQNAHPDWA